MTNVLSLEASKKLQEYMPENTQYGYNENQFILCDDVYIDTHRKIDTNYLFFKTLTLEEAIDMLPEKHPKYTEYWMRLEKTAGRYNVSYSECEPCNDMVSFEGKTLLEAVEKMLLYLHKENLLTKK